MRTLALLAASLAAPATAQHPVDFDREVRPILAESCFPCHGPDARKRKAGLRLDTREGAFAVLESGAVAVVGGDPAASELVRRIGHRDPGERMPPADSGRVLTDAQRRTLVAWVEAGAPWTEHWAWLPPAKAPPPAVCDAAWPRGDLDRFVLARLEREGLTPAPEADRATLIRRAALDLTGLPPEPEAVAAFVTDPAPDAYERLVDRLLSSPRYGEHMARYWLDAARYGDTHGLHLDNYREMWPYRDGVIAAFHDNQPYDRFVIEQLAGDLLPDATDAQKIASGFNRCHVTTAEGGSIAEEVHVRNVTDRTSTAGVVFMGMSVGCASCHDHKFDPLTQREFYELFAFFNNLDADPLDGNSKAHAPVLPVPSPAQRARLDELAAARAANERAARELLAAYPYREPPTEPAAGGERETIYLVDDDLPPGAAAEGDVVWVEASAAPVRRGARAMRRTSRGLQQHFFRRSDEKVRVAAGDTLFAWVWLDPEDPPRELMLQWNDDGAEGWDHRAFWGEDLIAFGRPGTSQRLRAGDLPPAGEWVRLAVEAAAVGLGSGHAVHGLAVTQYDGTAYWDAIGVETTAPQGAVDHCWVDDDAPAGADLRGDGANWQWQAERVRSGERALRRRAAGLSQDFFVDARPLVVRDGDVLFAHVWLDPDDPPRGIQLQWNDGSWAHRARWGAPAHGAGAGGGADFVAGELPPLGRWVRLEVAPRDVGLQTGARVHGQAFTQVGGTVYWDGAGVRTFSPPDERYLESQSAWEELAAGDAGVPAEVRAAIAVPADARDEAAAGAVRAHYLRRVHAGTRALMKPFDARDAELGEQVAAVEAAVPTTLVMRERAEPRAAYFLRRGQYDQRGERVERRTPAALPPMAASLPRDRLGLARWLVDPGHPLTARVAVNRFWQQVFGTGLVKTAEDFGTQGERPSHPELLDWLAVSFVDSGWNVKALMREIVTSATYRQSSRVTPELLARDPRNRLLARGPRFRLDAETLRDQALALGGLLVEQVGGPGVKPPQPDGLWAAVAYVGSNTQRFARDHGADKVHRRSLYTFFKRTAPPPQLATFDAPSREACVVRRERTNTPLQALLLLNDPQYVEAARGLGARILRAGGGYDRTRIAFAVRLVTCREADEAELAELGALVAGERAAFAREPAAARALIEVGELPPDPTLDPVELATWTLLGSLLLNLDEVVTKG